MNDAIRCFDQTLPHGITLACRAAGAGRVRAVLLHGFPEAAFVWDEVLQRLAPQAATVAPNLRGYIGSSAPVEVEAYRAKHLLTDLVALIEALGAPIDLLVAHDWGGAVGWAAAALRPDLLKRLLIINSPHPGTFLRDLKGDAEQQAASAYMNWLCQPDAERLLAEDDFRRLFGGFLQGSAWLTPAVKERYREAWRNQGRGLTGPLNYYRASPLRPPLASTDAIHTLQLPDALLTVKVPTTVLWGEEDIALRPSLLQGLERWVPDMTVQRVPDTGHWIVHEKPGLVAETIARLIG